MAPVSETLVRPVKVLSELTTQLEAAVLECMAKPKKKAVHKIRTTTRRIEAQLELLAVLPDLPPHGREAGKLRKLLQKLRSAAGAVRDLDVERRLIKDVASDVADRKVRKESKRLRRTLKERRNAEAEALIEVLRKERTKLPRAIAALASSLESASDRGVAERGIVSAVRGWYREHAQPHVQSAESGEPDELHAIRKVAKLARYLSEAAPESATAARKLASGFESLQQAGGTWHDWMQLSAVAAKELGKRAELPRLFEEHAQAALLEYQGLLRRRVRE